MLHVLHEQRQARAELVLIGALLHRTEHNPSLYTLAELLTVVEAVALELLGGGVFKVGLVVHMREHILLGDFAYGVAVALHARV